jgi:hypothetical protein
MATIITSGNATAHALDPISSSLLYFIKVYLDDNGAWEWNLRFVGVVSALVLTAIRLVFHKAYGVDWFSLANAIVTGFGALAIVYLNVFASEAMTGLSGKKKQINKPTIIGKLLKLIEVYDKINHRNLYLSTINSNLSFFINRASSDSTM